MLRGERREIARVRRSSDHRPSIQDAGSDDDERAKMLIVQFSMHYGLKNFLGKSNEALPGATLMGGMGRDDIPRNAAWCEEVMYVILPLLVHACERVACTH